MSEIMFIAINIPVFIRTLNLCYNLIFYKLSPSSQIFVGLPIVSRGTKRSPRTTCDRNNDSISLNSQQEFHLLDKTIFNRAFNITILKLKKQNIIKNNHILKRLIRSPTWLSKDSSILIFKIYILENALREEHSPTRFLYCSNQNPGPV